MSDSVSALLRARFGREFALPDTLEGNPVLEAIAGHTSHRRFTAEPVDAALLDTLLGCAFSAPSKSDLQQACVIHVQDRACREPIEALMPSMPWIATAPVLLLFCGDNRRIHRICEMRGKRFGNDHLDSFFNATVDASLAMMSFIVAAQGAGLGCCPLSAVRIHAREVSDAVALPEYVFPVAGLAVGHPHFGRRITPRLGTGSFVHRDRYDDTALDELIDAYDRRRDAVMPIAPDKQRNPDVHGEATFYGWSEDKARQVSPPERETFGAYVRSQGFDLD